MKDRILEFMKNEGLSNGRLAELIGVQSSNISHVINGRNKPGFDFIANILKRFPTLNPHWLILGIGDMYLNNSQNNISLDIDLESTEKITPVKSSESVKQKEVTPLLSNGINIFNDDIERIVLLKKDGTFITYIMN